MSMMDSSLNGRMDLPFPRNSSSTLGLEKRKKASLKPNFSTVSFS